jgi:hypothetical protein
MLSRARLSTSIGGCLTTVVGHNRQIKLGQAVHHSTTDTGNVGNRPHPVVLVGLSVDVRVALRFRNPGTG